MRGGSKRLYKHPLVVATVAFFLYAYIRFVYVTGRWELRGFEPLRQTLAARKPAIIAFWHGRLAMMSNFAPFPEDVHVMISRHGDGELIARVIRHFKFKLIRGSSNRASSNAKGSKNRGGAAALRAAVDILREGHSVCITPDGPKGPRMRVSSAIAELSQFTGVPIFAVTLSARPAKRFSSWDRFVLPLPFARGVLIGGKPVTIGKNADKEALEKARKDIENLLNDITREADEALGLVPVEPQTPYI